jgi:hypothetical protein
MRKKRSHDHLHPVPLLGAWGLDVLGDVMSHERQPMSEVGKHTNGPWHVVQDTLGSVADANGMTVAQAAQTKPIHCREDHNERLANARLLAAAPELLAACEAALSHIECDMDTGKRNPGECWCTDTGAGEFIDGVLVGDLLQCAACKCREAIAKARGVPQ